MKMAKIIKFENITKGVETKLQIINPKCRCFHPEFQIDVVNHEVICKQCGALVDPFVALLEYAEHQRRFIWQMEKYKAAQKEFEKIKAEWSLTIREKRRLEKAMQETRFPSEDFFQRETENE